ncbi:MAG: hypothetical protein ABSC72_07505 [Methylovirgula sp.]|jgi:hypothetical protein
MATIIELSSCGKLLKLDASLDSPDQELRRIYASPVLASWMQNELSTLESTWNVELTPAQQVDALAEIFCSGKPLTFDHQFKPLHPIRQGVWELKTADVRIFGWFPMQDCFVGWRGDLKDTIKDHGLYGGYVSETVRFREKLDLNEPKFLPGEDPHVVVSDFSYP